MSRLSAWTLVHPEPSHLFPKLVRGMEVPEQRTCRGLRPQIRYSPLMCRHRDCLTENPRPCIGVSDDQKNKGGNVVGRTRARRGLAGAGDPAP